jgi:F-type H+-transporting ATPase subunit b
MNVWIPGQQPPGMTMEGSYKGFDFMETLLTPDTGLIIWTVVIFAALVMLLGKVAWKPLLKALQEREDGIRKAIEDAAGAKKSAEDLKIQYEQELAKAQDKAAGLLSQAKTEALKLREQMLKDAEQEAHRLMEQTKRQLEEEKNKLSRELRQDVASLSIRVAEKLLRHSVNAKEQDALVQGFVKDLEKN